MSARSEIDDLIGVMVRATHQPAAKVEFERRLASLARRYDAALRVARAAERADAAELADALKTWREVGK